MQTKYMAIALVGALALSSATVANAANKFWKNSVGSGNWSTGNNWSAASAAGVDNAGVPTVDNSVVIAPTDGNNHNITYDYTGPALTLGSFSVDLTGPGTTTTTFSMSANNLTSQGLLVGVSGRGTVEQSGGTVSLSAGGGSPNLVLGDTVGSSGTYTLSGNGMLLASANEYIGNSGTGVFNQTGGTNTGSFFLYLGFASNGAGTYSLSGGSATFNSGTLVGGAGTGILNVSGTGVLNAGLTLTVADAPGSAVNLSGGTINTGALNFGGAPEDFNWTSGKLNLTTSVVWDPNVGPTSTSSAFGSSLTLGGNQTLMITGNETLANIGAFDLTLNSGSVHQVTGDITLNPMGTLSQNAGSTLSYSTLTQAGGAVNGTLLNLGNFVYQSGLFNGRLVNQGTVNLGSSFTAAGGVENVTSMSVNAGQVLNANGAGLENKGALTLAGGTINTTELNLHGSPATFNWSNGTLNLTNDVTWDSAAEVNTTASTFGSQLILANNQTLKVTGDETLGGLGAFNLQLISGGTHTVTGNLTIGTNGTLTQFFGSTLNTPTITLAGGTINGDGFANSAVLAGHGTLGGEGGFVNLGAMTVSGGTLTIDNTGANANSGVIAVPAGQQLELLSGSFDNVGTINLSGGAISGTSFFGNTAGIISGHGTIANLILNSGSMVVDTGILNVNSNIASNGEIYLAGGLATLGGTGAVNNSGLIRGDGVVTKVVNNNAIGEIRAEFGKRLKLSGVNGANAGQINLQGGTAEFAQALTNASGGQIIGRGTIIVGGAGLSNQGHVALSSGISDVFGDVTNNTGVASRGISVSGNADVTFWDDVTNVAGSLFRVSAGSSATFFGSYGGGGNITGTGDTFFEADVSPGASPASVTFGGNVYLGSNASLQIELGGTTLGTYDRIVVAGDLVLDGLLEVSILPGFTPGAGQSFDILNWGSLDGEFFDVDLPTLAGLTWNTSQLYATGVLSLAAAGLLGDYNGNDVIDAGDYTVWRDALAAGATDLLNDPSPGVVDGSDFTYWRDHFGDTLGGGAGAGAALNSQAAVPEPNTLAMLCVGSILGLAARRRGRR